MSDLPQDLRVTLRGLRRAPTFTLTAVLVLGLGIGMSVAMYAVFDAVLLRPLPVREQDRIVLPRTVDPRGTDVAMSWDNLKQLARESRTLAAVAGEAHQGAFGTTLLDGERPLVLRTAWVTGNFFDLLGARPALGRLFHSEDESEREASVVVLSYDTWQRQFGGDSAVIGHTLTNPYTRSSYTIIGVAPAGIGYPAGAEYWTPNVYSSALNVVARLKPGVSAEAARAEFLTMMSRIYRASGFDQPIVEARIRTFTQAVTGDVQPALRVLVAAVALLLLIACVNVANLLLLRAHARGHEFAVRRSLGAGTADIARVLLLETGVVALAGGVLGSALSWALLRVLLSLAPAELPRTDVLRLGGVPLGAAIGVTLGVSLLIGLLQAAAARRSFAPILRLNARAGSETSSRRRLRQGLVASQLALALVLLAGAGLLVRSFEKLQAIDLGYQADHLSLINVAVPVAGVDPAAKFAALLDRVPPALHELRGVTSLTPAVVPPFYGPHVFVAHWEADGRQSSVDDILIPIEAGGAEYFGTMGIPLLRGRGFLDSDRENSPAVAVVSEAAAKLLWPGKDPIGQRLRYTGDTSAGAWRTVIGLAGDIHFRRLREATPTVYVPTRQFFFQGLFAVRTSVPIETLLPAMREAIRSADPEATIVRAQTMDELLGEQLALPRLSSLLLTGFGLAALLLAAIGLYGVMASLVRERRHELGVRAALGATPARLRRDVLRQALAVSLAGAAVGLAAALAVSRLLASLLFEVRPTDPLSLLGSCGLLMLVALAAAWLPAHWATTVDPARALRAE